MLHFLYARLSIFALNDAQYPSFLASKKFEQWQRQFLVDWLLYPNTYDEPAAYAKNIRETTYEKYDIYDLQWTLRDYGTCRQL